MWRFIGFVLLVIGGLAAVFYYTGMNEDPGGRIGKDRKQGQSGKVTQMLPAGKPVEASAPPADRTAGAMRFGGSILITPAELRAKEEQELASELESTGEIVEVLKDVGDEVKPGDVLVKLKDSRILQTIRGQEIQATSVADSKIASAENAKDVYEKNMTRLQGLLKTGAASVAEFELERARFIQATTEIEKSKYEKQFEMARLAELKEQYQLYQLRARIPGTVVRVLKKRGNTLRQGETVMYIVNDRTLVAEGAVESGLAGLLKVGMTAVVEPENDRESVFMFDGHTGPVNNLALAPQSRFVASSSEDGTVILWSLQPLSRLPWLRLERPDGRRVGCRAVAVSPIVLNDSYQLLAGYADGQLVMWTVQVSGTGTKVEARDLGKDHDQGVNCICFRSDGKYAATGGDDRRVALWDMAAGKRLYWVHPDDTTVGNAHYGAVTSVLFDRDMQHLITSGTDNALRRWKLGSGRSELERTLHGRTGDVGKINLAQDGRRLIFENNEELRILDSKTFEPRSVLNSRRSGRFVQFAQISPDGRLAVAATDQGQNMLIRLPKLTEGGDLAQQSQPAKPSTATPVSTEPAASTPASESTPDLWRQEGAIGAHFTLPEAVRATCAEFLSDGQRQFVLMGSTDNKIRIYNVPTEAELNHPILARLKFVSSQVESGTGLVRVQAEFENTRGLKTGKRVAMIVYPDASDHGKEAPAAAPTGNAATPPPTPQTPAREVTPAQQIPEKAPPR